ncbi:Uncharacterised protein [Mycobacteroides abscessus subsp. abscessus]|nr:Uncharacterised protein [Mycobacteroides abscessus subsp. abscessus]
MFQAGAQRGGGLGPLIRVEHHIDRAVTVNVTRQLPALLDEGRRKLGDLGRRVVHAAVMVGLQAHAARRRGVQVRERGENVSLPG